MRRAGQQKLGYYPTPVRVTEMIRGRLAFPASEFAALDPCAGCGTALKRGTEGGKARTYGIEPDGERVETARGNLDHVLHCTREDAQISHGAFSLLWLNPPYDTEHVDAADFEQTGRKTTRKERVFLRQCLPLLAPGGVLVFIVPAHILDAETTLYLATQLDNLESWHFPEPERDQFKQAVAIGTRARGKRADARPVPVTEEPPTAAPHIVPTSRPDVKIFRTKRPSPEELRDASRDSALWAMLAPNPHTAEKAPMRPPLPLHTGHLSLLLAGGSLDGIIGEGADRHMVRGLAIKQKRTTKESHDSEAGTIVTTTRVRDSYAVGLKVLTTDGHIQTLI